MTDEFYFNISEMKLSITLVYIMSNVPKYDIIWTENSDVIDSFISEILKYELSVIASSTEKPWAALFTPKSLNRAFKNPIESALKVLSQSFEEIIK